MPRQQWEYMLIEWVVAPQVWNLSWGNTRGRVAGGFGKGDIVTLLNAQGAEGLELVSAEVSRPPLPDVYVLKRQMS